MRKIKATILYGVLGLALLLLGCLIVLSVDTEYQRTTDLGRGVALIETVHITRSPITQIVDSGPTGSAIILKPFRSEDVIHQKVMRNGGIIWEGRADKTYSVSVSPDHHYLVVWDHVHTEWWHAFDLATGADLEIHLPEHPGIGDGMVPLRFGQWSGDSHFVLVAVDGEEVEKPNAWMVYRETYLLDPATGNFYKQRHCHQPYPEGHYTRPDWANTPCAGTYQD